MERFDKYMSTNGLNDNQVTQQCCLSVGLLGKARQGKSDLGQKAIEKILNTYQDLSKVWLLTGEGDMLKPQPTMSATIGDGAAIAQINSTNNGTMSVTSGNAYQQAAEDDTKEVLAECKALLSQVTTLVSSATQMVNTALAMNADTKKCIQEHHEKLASHTK